MTRHHAFASEPPPEVESYIYALLDTTQDDQPVPVRLHRHPLRYPHVWFILLSLVAAISTTSSLYPRYVFEHLIYAIIAFNLLALVFSLTQDLRFRNRSPVGDQPSPPAPPTTEGFWREAQLRAGINPVKH